MSDDTESTETTAESAAVWIATDEKHIVAVVASQALAQHSLDEYLSRLSQIEMDPDGWYEPGVPEVRVGAWFQRWYRDGMVVRGSQMRTQSVQRFEVRS